MPRFTHSSMLKFACVSFLLVGFSGCGAASKTPSWIGPTDYEQERAVEAARLTWPNGVVPSYPPALASFAGKGLSYQPGVGTSDMDQMWFCSWSKEWLDHLATDPTQAAAALKTLDGMKTMQIWTAMGAGGDQDMSGALDKAHLGDPEPLKSWREMFACES